MLPTGRIIAFAEAWATHNQQFEVKEARAHLSRDEQGRPQEGGQDWEEEGYLTGYEVCLDMPTFGDIRNTVVVVSSTGRLEIDDSAGGDQGCAVCDHGHIREYLPESEVNGHTAHRELM